MNKDVKRLWTAALRSGEYKQGQYWLRSEDTYCCLGVLCDLHHKAGLGNWSTDGHYQNEDEVLPDSVMEWAGLSDEKPRAGDHLLTDYNDGYPPRSIEIHSFAEIADLIEQHL